MGSFSVIYDTNTFISAYGWGGKPERAIKIGFRGDIEVYVSLPIIDEYRTVLRYDHLDFSAEDQNAIPDEFRDLTDARLQNTTVDLSVVEDDPDDDKFLELAVEVDADYIVSGDTDLKQIGYYEHEKESHEGTHIISSGEFLDEIDVDPFEESLRESC